jgi:4-amino-4-deoxy-L-arabinose transferase-like glycosyltransferase
MLQAACYVLYRFFKQFVTSGTALFIFLAISFYIPFWILSYSLEPNALNILLVVLTIEMLYRIAMQPSRKRWMQLGCLIGIQLWVRPDILIGFALFAFWLILFAKDKLNNKVKGLALSIAIALVIIAPWTIRNYVTFHRFVFISANSGMNLYEGNNYVATGQFGTLPPTPESERENAQILSYQANHDAIDIDEYRLHLAEQWMLAHPMQVIALDLKKALWHWIGRSEVGEQYHYGRHTLAVFYRVVSLLLLPLGFYGLILLKDRILKSLIFTMFIYSTAISAIFFVQSRHRTLKVDPFLVPLATIGLMQLVQKVRKKKPSEQQETVYFMEEMA